MHFSMRGISRVPFQTVACVAAGVGVGVGIIVPVGKIACVEGQSMRPTLNPNNHLEDIVFVLSSKFSSVSRGDVVILSSPKDEKTELIKRVVGLEGDVVSPRHGYSIIEVPKGHCWVEGDNVRMSEDSNYFGPVPMELIIGKATRIIWPPNRWGRISKEIPPDREPVSVKTTEHTKAALSESTNEVIGP